MPNRVRVATTLAIRVFLCCATKGMMPGITEMLERVATSKGINWAETLEELKKKGQWHVEVY
eukprot:CAMPEP_0179878384 /NCGR_PEP_ID=MMETSP0982-20121206/25350_1 /TAXON_ID=483367 /ORGANISM="non described non described, Strain CCMP 2436" /LENGTH=61 /DNA_ID=CAMNT_0021771157 /DNA_START=277 /DNA_END=462 /DNA_ORIENTATION=+